MEIAHPEFAVYKHLNGVKVQASQAKNGRPHLLMSELLALPYNIYAYDRDNRFVQSNELSADFCGTDSINSLLGKDVFSITNKDYASCLANNNKNVLASNFHFIIDEAFYRLNDKQIYAGVTIKLPIYDDRDEIVGVMGASSMFESTSTIRFSEIAAFLNLMLEAGLLNSHQQTNYNNFLSSKSTFEDIYFTKREKQIILQLIKGRASRTISENLSISKRTVETHIENIKLKAAVGTKAELVEKLMDLFY